MTILDLMPGLKRAAGTCGGEWAGACPFCGGRDRFRVWPTEGPTGRFWCRSCGKHGDAIQLLRDRDGLSFREACERLGAGPSFSTRPATWTPKTTTTPGGAWMERAAAFLLSCQRTLAGPAGVECRAFLAGRGLAPETIERAGLGWHGADKWESRRAWGLPEEVKENGNPRRVWLPAGLVIPCFAGGRLVRLRVRRPEPGDGPRYVVFPGSASSPLTLGHGGAWIVVESELDGLLLHQAAGDLTGIMALGSAQARPDAETDRKLRAAYLLLISLDTDGAGAKESWNFWKLNYRAAKRWPIPADLGKDPTEAKQAGLDLRAWILAGLPDLEPTSTPKPATTKPAPVEATAKPEAQGTASGAGEGLDQGSERRAVFEPFPTGWNTRYTEDQLERLSILTVDAGLPDLEAAEVIGQC